jgi:hypothetical protein
MGQFQSGSGSGIAGPSRGSGSHCYRLLVHIEARVRPLPDGQALLDRRLAAHESPLHSLRGDDVALALVQQKRVAQHS